LIKKSVLWAVLTSVTVDGTLQSIAWYKKEITVTGMGRSLTTTDLKTSIHLESFIKAT
jgi:hypothetical protein